MFCIEQLIEYDNNISLLLGRDIVCWILYTLKKMYEILNYIIRE